MTCLLVYMEILPLALACVLYDAHVTGLLRTRRDWAWCAALALLWPLVAAAFVLTSVTLSLVSAYQITAGLFKRR